jgi:hypothetical protein
LTLVTGGPLAAQGTKLPNADEVKALQAKFKAERDVVCRSWKQSRRWEENHKNLDSPHGAANAFFFTINEPASRAGHKAGFCVTRPLTRFGSPNKAGPPPIAALLAGLGFENPYRWNTGRQLLSSCMMTQ